MPFQFDRSSAVSQGTVPCDETFTANVDRQTPLYLVARGVPTAGNGNETDDQNGTATERQQSNWGQTRFGVIGVRLDFE